MEQVIVVFSSVTAATGVKKHLWQKYNIQSKLRQTPKNLSFSGCSYCLMTSLENVDIIKKIAMDNKLTIRGIFREDGTRV